MATAINYNDRMLYEHLGLIIEQYEKAALESGSRQGFLATANGPLAAMDSILESTEIVLEGSEDPDAERDPGTPGSVGDPEVQQGVQLISGEHASITVENTGDNLLDVSVSAGFDLSLDDDLREALGEEFSANASEWLTNCLGCEGRTEFSWQLQPTNLLGPIEGLMDDIEASIGSFNAQINPFGLIDDLCNMMNGIDFLCIPDIVGMLMGLKLLLRKYLTFALEIRLDWTAIVGPLLKVILDGINSFIQMISGVIQAPLDCAIGALNTVHQFQLGLGNALKEPVQIARRFEERAVQVAGVAQTIEDGTPGLEVAPIDNERFEAYVNFRDISAEDGRINTRDRRISEPKTSNFSLNTGYQLDINTSLPDAMKDPSFLFADWTPKLTLAMADAKRWIQDLDGKIQSSIASVQSLTSNGLTVQLGNLGLIVFIYDMISLILTALRLRRTNPNVSDWCQLIQENPDEIRPLLDRSTSRTIGMLSEENAIALYSGPERVGRIRTCYDDDNVQSDMLRKWISELKGATT